MREITTATFDCFGTLIDWEGGIGNFLYDTALRHGDLQPPPGGALRERWEAIQFEVIQGPYMTYKLVLAESLRLWCLERGYPYEERDGAAIARSMRSWQPFHEARPALEAARASGLKLVIISNSDHDLIAHSIRHIGIQFDDVIVAEDCGAYKPDRRVFETALARIGEAPERMLHVAFGFKYDIGPGQEFGWKTAWVNRNAEPAAGPVTADYEWRDLWGLTDI
jgi:2-haloacid dehalogenase